MLECRGRWQRLLGGSSHEDRSASWGRLMIECPRGAITALCGQCWLVSTASRDAAVIEELTQLSPEAWTMAS